MMLNKVVNIDRMAFAEHCFDTCAIRDLQTKLTLPPKADELKKWNLTHEQWKRQILIAIDMIERD